VGAAWLLVLAATGALTITESPISTIALTAGILVGIAGAAFARERFARRELETKLAMLEAESQRRSNP
jgi:hypothetical protein